MIKLTDNAIERLHKIADKNGKRYVRLSIKGGGCAGFEYKWDFDNEQQRGDMLLKDIFYPEIYLKLYMLLE